ncbi:hypothetical protein HK100_010616, partial [Physocladia obscura]
AAKNLLDDFNSNWVDLWVQTDNYNTWAQDPLGEYSLTNSPGHLKHGAASSDPVSAALKGIRDSIAPIQSNIEKVLGQAEAGLTTAVTNLTSSEQQKVMQETFNNTISSASKVAESTLHKTKEVAQDIGKVAEQAFSSAGKVAENAATNASKIAKDGLDAVVAGLKDPHVMQDNASKVAESVSTNAKKLWANLGTWGGGLLDGISALQENERKQEEERKRESAVKHSDADDADDATTPFVVGEDISHSVQDLKLHSEDGGVALGEDVVSENGRNGGE